MQHFLILFQVLFNSKMILILTTVLFLGAVHAGFKNVNKELYGRTVSFELLEQRGEWLDARDTYWGKFSGSSESDVHKKVWARFRVRNLSLILAYHY